MNGNQAPPRVIRAPKAVKVLAGVVTFGLFSVTLGFVIAGPAVATNGNSSLPKVTFCHRDNNEKQPYGPKAITTDAAAVIKQGHDGHTGPIFAPGMKAAGIKWGDIIPPFDYVDKQGVTQHYAGMNWTLEGQALVANNCQLPGPTTTTTPPVTTSTTTQPTETTTQPSTTTTTTTSGLDLTLYGCSVSVQLLDFRTDVSYHGVATPPSGVAHEVFFGVSSQDGTGAFNVNEGGVWHVTVVGSDGSSVSGNINVPADCGTPTTTTTTTPPVTTSTTTQPTETTTTTPPVTVTTTATQPPVTHTVVPPVTTTTKTVAVPVPAPSVSGPKSVTGYVTSSPGSDRNEMLAMGISALFVALFGASQLRKRNRTAPAHRRQH